MSFHIRVLDTFQSLSHFLYCSWIQIKLKCKMFNKHKSSTCMGNKVWETKYASIHNSNLFKK